MLFSSFLSSQDNYEPLKVHIRSLNKTVDSLLVICFKTVILSECGIKAAFVRFVLLSFDVYLRCCPLLNSDFSSE